MLSRGQNAVGCVQACSSTNKLLQSSCKQCTQGCYATMKVTLILQCIVLLHAKAGQSCWRCSSCSTSRRRTPLCHGAAMQRQCHLCHALQGRGRCRRQQAGGDSPHTAALTPAAWVYSALEAADFLLQGANKQVSSMHHVCWTHECWSYITCCV